MPDETSVGKSPAAAGGTLDWMKLAAELADANVEVARAAKRTMWHAVRVAGRPGAADERRRTVASLIALIRGDHVAAAVYREVIWMLSEIGGDESLDVLASLLAHPTAREDARLALERIPGERSLAVLRAALSTSPDDFKPHLVQSLRARGVAVEGFPSQKLLPKKQTGVQPLAPAEKS